MRLKTCTEPPLHDHGDREQALAELDVGSTTSSATVAAGSNTCASVASTSAALCGNTRKIVPSATPAASAIWRV